MRTRMAASIGALVLALGVLMAPAASAEDPTFSVTATVATRGGTPIPDEDVRLLPAGGSDEDPVDEGATDASGVITFRDVPAGDYVVSYRSVWEQSAPATVAVTVDGSEEVSFVHPRLVALSGQVVDDLTGEPVPYVMLSGYRELRTAELTLPTDVNGRGATFAPAGSYTVRFDEWHEVYRRTVLAKLTLKAGSDVTGRAFRLVRKSHVTGRVTLGDKAVDDARVLIGSGYVQTSSSGRYSRDVEPGSYSVRVSGDSERRWFTTYLGGTVRKPDAKKVVVPLGRDGVADIALVRSATVKGRVVGRDGRPAKGITVYAWNTDREGQVNARTNSDGRYTLRGLATGEVALQAQGGTSSLPAEGKTTVWARQGEAVAAKQITLMDDAIIYGQVTTAGSSPTRQDVSLSTSTGTFLGTFRPDADGWVGFAALPAGTYYVHVDGSNLRRQVVVRAHMTATFGTLTRGELRTVSGRVTDWAGKPVAGASVHVYDQYGTAYATVRTGSTGRYTIRSVVSGSYQVKVTPKASSPLAWGQVALSVRAGKDSVRDVRLGKGATITGLVVTTKGKPAIGVTVWSQEGHKATTDATGRYTLTGVKPGRQTLKITDPDYVGGYRDATTTVTAKGGATVTAARATVR